MRHFIRPFVLAVAALLAGCGGGSYSSPATPAAPTPPFVPDPPVAHGLDYYQNRCVAQPGSFANTTAGTLDDEKNFLRLWIDATYLWYREVPAVDMAAYATAVDYFDVLKTPLLTASGQPKDRFHFSYPDELWNDISAGVESGFGITWVQVGDEWPRDWRIAAVEPGSSAALAGMRRGDRLLTVDGVDFVNGGTVEETDRINAGLFPAATGETHRFGVQHGATTLNASLVSALVTVAPVQNTRVIDTPQGPVGYLTFGNHIAPAEPQLVAAFDTLRKAGVKDLVLDLRYNGGGLLSIASEVAYMIAGAQASGKVFEDTLVNDKTPQPEPLLFLATAEQTGAALPALDLKRVYVLTGPGTCSASESIVNGLRGIDVEVHLVGSQTCGKPYAFTPMPNCGTTYFAIQYQGVNAKGFGDFSDGFLPTCAAADDLNHELGSSDETMLATALQLRAGGSCPAPAAGARSAARALTWKPVRALGREIKVYDVK